MHGRRTLIAAACLSSAIALLHIAIILVGAPAYRYFGAGEEMARQSEAGSFLPALLTGIITLLFAAFAFYAFAGAQKAPRPPLLRTGLIAIGLIYLLRGLFLAPQLLGYFSNAPLITVKELAFSAVSLLTGILYLLGTWRSWPDLAGARRPDA